MISRWQEYRHRHRERDREKTRERFRKWRKQYNSSTHFIGARIDPETFRQLKKFAAKHQAMHLLTPEALDKHKIRIRI